MQNISTFIIELMVMLLTVLPTSAQELVWEPTNGPYGGYIPALLTTPDGKLFAGTEGGGVFRSDDGGNTWTKTGLTNAWITSFAVLGEWLYASTYREIFRSDDGGNTWTLVNAELRNVSFAIMDTTLFAGTYDGEVFRALLSK